MRPRPLLTHGAHAVAVPGYGDGVSIDQLVVTLRTLGLPEWAEVTPTTLQSVDAA